MEELHETYKQFIKKQKPKYGETFIDWLINNRQVDNVNLLQVLSDKNVSVVPDSEFGVISSNSIGYFRDFFTKKLQLCNNVLATITSQDNKYNTESVNYIMDLYEDIIQEICANDNVNVCKMPHVSYKNNIISVEHKTFNCFDDLKEEFKNGVSFVYTFYILENGYINIHHYNHQPLTRKVLFEG